MQRKTGGVETIDAVKVANGWIAEFTTAGGQKHRGRQTFRKRQAALDDARRLMSSSRINRG
jgi:hypothetical protein